VFLLTEEAKLVCEHLLGRLKVEVSQSFVTIQRRIVLVEVDPEDKRISGCPNYGPTIKPCTRTLKVKQGYSDLIRIDGRRACLDTVEGLTNGTPPGIVKYRVAEPGQDLVSEEPA
jgi:hypothetical protein